jgi:hypothetical protein
MSSSSSPQATTSPASGDSALDTHRRIGLWTVVIVKIAAAILPLLALGRPPRSRWQRGIRALAWVEVVILTSYGLVLTVPGFLIQAGVLRPGRGADHRALEWHAYLWDPWFLLWGLLAGAALLRGPSRGQATPVPGEARRRRRAVPNR